MTLQRISTHIIKISATAGLDLKDIWKYHSERSDLIAANQVKEITKKFGMLRDNPFIGRPRDEYLIGLRSFVVRGYFIFYLPLDNGIEILRVLHSSHDIERIFQDFFESLPDAG